MSIKSRSDLKAYVDAYIDTNGIDAITGEVLNDFLNDLADSAINKNGDTGILGKLRYNSLFILNNDADLVYKKYVDDAVGVFTQQIWITNVPNPIDGLYHKIKMTMGVDAIPQYEDLGPV